MKIAAGVCITVLLLYLCGPLIFRAMKKRDYDAIYHGMQDAKRASGAYVQTKEKRYRSYEEDYAYGRN